MIEEPLRPCNAEPDQGVRRGRGRPPHRKLYGELLTYGSDQGRLTRYNLRVLMRQFVRRTRIMAPVERVFQWHELPDVFEKLTPPREPVRVLQRSGGIRDGGRMLLEIGYPPLSIRWAAEHSAYIENRQFRDIQVRGPFRRWVHTHLFEADGPDACYLEDRIEYAMRFGIIGDWLLGWMVERKLDRLFQYRHRITREANL